VVAPAITLLSILSSRLEQIDFIDIGLLRASASRGDDPNGQAFDLFARSRMHRRLNRAPIGHRKRSSFVS